MRTALTCLYAMIVLALAVPAWSQAPDAPPPPQAQGAAEIDLFDLMRQMGAGEKEIMVMRLLSQVAGIDPGQAMLLMMLGEGGNVDEDLVGLLLFSRVLGGSGNEPVALLAGDFLLVIERGVVYKIDLATMKVQGSVAYRQRATTATIPAEMGQLIQQARDKALLSSCLTNMKQLCLAALMYTQDWDDTLPGENWPQQLEPYLKNREIFRCPGAQDREIGFALNDALAGAMLGDIKNPAETVLFFESDQPEDVPFGGADELVKEPRHAGMIVVGFADGHVKAVTLEKARELLERDPFK